MNLLRSCRTCCSAKPTDQFYRSSRGSFFADCKACVLADRKRCYLETETLKQRVVERQRTPLGMFNTQRANAAARGIEWHLTFDEWLGIWVSSGKWEQRGLHRGQYVMARHGDLGPYAVGNVKIITTEANIAERYAHAGSIKNFSEKGFGNAWEKFPRGPA